MNDLFDGVQSGLESPAAHLADVTPDDANDLAQVSRAIAVSQAGQIRVTTLSGETGTIFVAAGVPFPIRVQRIWASGTTASGIVSLW